MIAVGSTTLAVAMQMSVDNTAALIGGIVGGIVALLLIVCVIAFMVKRNRKASQENDKGHSLPASAPGAISQPSNIYDRITVPRTSTPNEYDAASDPLRS